MQTTQLTGPQLQVLQALLSGHTVASAAEVYQISERTIRDWKRQPAFRSLLEEGQAQLVQETCTLLSVAAAEAIKALVQVCQDPLEKGSARVAAAGRLLTFLFRHLPEPAAPRAHPDVTEPSDTSACPVSTSAIRGPSTLPTSATEPAANDPSTPSTVASTSMLAAQAPDPADAYLPPLLAGHPMGPPADLRRPLTRTAAGKENPNRILLPSANGHPSHQASAPQTSEDIPPEGDSLPIPSTLEFVPPADVTGSPPRPSYKGKLDCLPGSRICAGTAIPTSSHPRSDHMAAPPSDSSGSLPHPCGQSPLPASFQSAPSVDSSGFLTRTCAGNTNTRRKAAKSGRNRSR